jgi:hypothetical protein
MTRRQGNETSVWLSSQKGTARHQHGESAGFIHRFTSGGQIGVMMLYRKQFEVFPISRGSVANTAFRLMVQTMRRVFLFILFLQKRTNPCVFLSL